MYFCALNIVSSIGAFKSFWKVHIYKLESCNYDVRCSNHLVGARWRCTFSTQNSTRFFNSASTKWWIKNVHWCVFAFTCFCYICEGAVNLIVIYSMVIAQYYGILYKQLALTCPQFRNSGLKERFPTCKYNFVVTFICFQLVNMIFLTQCECTIWAWTRDRPIYRFTDIFPDI